MLLKLSEYRYLTAYLLLTWYRFIRDPSDLSKRNPVYALNVFWSLPSFSLCYKYSYGAYAKNKNNRLFL